MDAVQWFADQGVTSYRDQIEDLRARRQEIVAEGGISFFGDHRAQLAMIDAEIGSVRRAASVRYEELVREETMEIDQPLSPIQLRTAKGKSREWFREQAAYCRLSAALCIEQVIVYNYRGTRRINMLKVAARYLWLAIQYRDMSP